MGLAGIALSTAAFIFLGMTLANLGSELQRRLTRKLCEPYVALAQQAHRFADDIFHVCHSRGDAAGAGALLEQKLGLPAAWGSALVTLLVIAATCLKLKKSHTDQQHHASTDSGGTRYRDLCTGNSRNRPDDTEPVGAQSECGTSHWALGAMLYVSYNIFGCVAILPYPVVL